MPWDLIVDDAPMSGAWNMAVDDYLLQSLGGGAQTCLRFYSWERPTVSLGYSQNADRVLDLEFCREQGIDVVRRSTGGKMVLHHREVTYAICSSDTETFSASLPDSYRLISESLTAGLRKMGLDACRADAPPASYVRSSLPCFSYPGKDEIVVMGKKLVGSAQKRIGTRFLQHGSIPLEKDDELLIRLASLPATGDKIRMISLSEALGRPVDFSWAVTCLSEGMAGYFGVSLKRRILSAEEKTAISRLQKDRHADPGWLFKGPSH